MTDRKAVNPVEAHVRGLDGEYYLYGEVAALVGISLNALRALTRRYPEELGPSGLTYLGWKKIYLFEPADIDALRRYLAAPERERERARGRGRPPLWTHAEQQERHRRHAAAYYWRKRSEQLAAQGCGREAREARRTHDALSRALKREHTQRLAAVTRARRPSRRRAA